jgi:RNA polymerase sigma-70 factor (ECF subfamily)
MLVLVGKKSGSVETGQGMAEVDEPELIRRCKAGERAAHDELYHRFRRQVAANLYRVLGDRGEIEDLVQEVFVIAFRGLATFRHEARLATWLYRICVNVALGKIRARTRRPPPIGGLDLDQAAHGAALTDRPESPERTLERRDDVARVYRALDRLAPKKRMVLYLHEIEGRDLKEIAYLVDANAVTVRTRLFYARREFYRALVDEGGASGPAPAMATMPAAANDDADRDGGES